MAHDARLRYLARVLAQQYAMSLPAVEDVLLDEKHIQPVTDFLDAEGPPSLIFFRQAREAYSEDGELIESSGGAYAPAMGHSEATGPMAQP